MLKRTEASAGVSGGHRAHHYNDNEVYDIHDDKGAHTKRQRSWRELLQLYWLKLRIKKRVILAICVFILILCTILMSEAFYDHFIYASVVWWHRFENYVQDLPWQVIPFMSGYQTFTTFDKIDVQSVVTRGPDSFCTIHEEVPLLVYMHVPKTAGTTMTDLLRELSPINHFIVSVSSRLYSKSKDEINHREADLASYLSSFSHKTAESAHVRFLDFPKHGQPEPLYIGTFRNPIERMQSHYNYDSFAKRPMYVNYKLWVKGERSVSMPNLVQCVRKYINMNISAADIPYGTDGTVTDPRVRAALKRIPKQYSCLKKKYINVQVKYYCGYHRNCKSLETHSEMTQIAINNLPRFQVIMLTDRMHTSVHLLEKMMPNFFRGSTNIYENHEKAMSVKAATSLITQNKVMKPRPYTCSYEPEEEVVKKTNTAMHRKYCVCNGTVYYGRKYDDDAGDELSLDDLKLTNDYITADASRTGGMHCTHKLSVVKGGFPADPAPQARKQCICDPLPPHDTRGLSFLELFHMRSNANTISPSRVDMIPKDVLDFLQGFLHEEMLLYEGVKKHFENNVKRCNL